MKTTILIILLTIAAIYPTQVQAQAGHRIPPWLIASSGRGASTECTVVRDNLNASNQSVQTDQNAYLAGSFWASNTYTTCKIIMQLKRLSPALTGVWNVQLWSNSGTNTPLVMLDTSDNSPAVDTAISDITFTGLSVALTSGVRYWIVLYHSGGGDNSGDSIVAYDGASTPNDIYISNNGVNWTSAAPFNSFDFQLIQF